jgi:septum site-determining protein MinC
MAKMEDASVVFKGSVNGLSIIMKEEDEFDAILEQIEKKIVTAGKFFKGASLSVKYRGKKLSKVEEDLIFSLLSQTSGAEIKSIDEDMEERTEDNTGTQSKIRIKPGMSDLFFFKGIDEGITRFYKGTVRSGQLVSFRGNLVVIGDVNPGGVLEAAGNIIVLGSLRGTVHAGSDGNREAFVIALHLQPVQLRIADVITRSPDEKYDKNQQTTEMAYVKDDLVYIEQLLQSR